VHITVVMRSMVVPLPGGVRGSPALSAVITATLAATLAGSPAARAQPAPSELQRAGAAALEGGRLGEALALYERALGAARSDGRVWFDLCLVRYAAGDYGRAIDACYRALSADEDRAIMLLDRIAAAMKAARVSPGALVVPEPVPQWSSPDSWLPGALSATEPPEAARATRALDPERPGADGSLDVIAADRLDRLRGRRPPLPYQIPARKGEYGVGLDLSARGGVLFYAPDTTPLVSGVRAELRRRVWGTSSHTFYFGEYLHAVDKTGGIGAAGIGSRGGSFSASIGLSVPWGRSEGRRYVLIPDHTLALHGELRIGVHRELMIDRKWAVSFEAGLVGGLNLAKAAIRFGDKLSDACGEDETDCPMTPDANPGWPLGHWMVQLGVSFGYRGRYPRYDRAEVFAPKGGS